MVIDKGGRQNAFLLLHFHQCVGGDGVVCHIDGDYHAAFVADGVNFNTLQVDQVRAHLLDLFGVGVDDKS